MYRVVGCRDCGALWVVEDRPSTTSCQRCGKRHEFEKLHAFAETETPEAARQARAVLLADRAGQGELFEELEDRVRGQLEFDAVPPESAVEEAGLDADAIAAAGDRATAGPDRPPGHREVVLAAVETLDRPTEAEVTDYAAERGVPPDTVERLLDGLRRRGEVSESGGRYRRL